MKRILLFGLLTGILASSAGCGLFQAIFCYRPCVVRGDYGGPCGWDGCAGDECGMPCRPGVVRRPWVARGGVCCDPCGDPCSDPCGYGCCYGRCWHRGPLSCIFALFAPGCWWGPNCGERYWGDFYSDPPDCWDPCDGSGNYTGGGCASCGGYSRADYGGLPTQRENILSESERVVEPAPTPATGQSRAAPPVKSSRRRTMSYAM